MRLAIVDENDEIFVEYDLEIVRKMLKTNMETMPFDEAFNKIVISLKNMTLRK